jgi:Cdc6-like AAA superfamily ATPase
MELLESYGLKYDPFSMNPLVGDPQLRLFIDREKELEYAITTVLLGKNLLVTGQRGIGKTTFIYALRQRVLKREPAVFFIFVRLAMETRDSVSLLSTLALELERHKSELPLTSERIRKNQEYLEAISRASIDDLLMVIRASVEELKKKYGKLVFVFDDVDKMNFRLDILAGVRDALWNMNVVYIISSSLRQFEDVEDSAMRPFFSVIELRGFEEAQARMLIEKRLKMASDNKCGIEDFMDNSVFHNINEISHGNPMSLLYICSHVFNFAVVNRAKRITNKDLFNFVQNEMFDGLTPAESQIIAILKKNPKGLSVHQIFESIKKNAVSISRPRVSQLLNGFYKKGLVTPKKMGRSTIYSLAVPLKEKSE